MALQICIDALIYWNGAVLANRNDVSISQDVAIAEAKPFVASVSVAYATKTPTWKNWKMSVKGYYDDTDSTVQNAIKNGTVGQIVVYPTRTDVTAYWYGQAFVTNAPQNINSNEYSTLDSDFEGSGVLTWVNA